MKDFPEEYLSSHSLSAISADDFVTDIVDLNPEKALGAFKDMVANRKNPDLDEYEVLDKLRRNGLLQSANYIHSLL